MNGNRLYLILLIGLLFCSAVAPASATAQQEEQSAKPIGLSRDQRLRELLEAIQAHHIQPPTRQQMILETVKLAADHQKSPVPTGFSAALSALSDVDAMYALMNEELTRSGASKLPEVEFDELMLSGLSHVVDGGFVLVPQKEQRVNEQLAANRYVGIGIQVGTTPDTNELRIVKAMEGGTAHEAGIQDGDVVEAVDGRPTKDVPLGSTVDWLRGPEGSTVKVTIRRDTSKELEIVRRVVPIKTVQRISFPQEPTCTVLRPDRIGASTVHELQKAVSELDGSVKTVIVDLRFQSGGSIHHQHLLADAILDEVDCGFVETRTDRRALRTESGTFCDGREIAIVYSPGVSSRIDWLAAIAAEQGVSVFRGMEWNPQNAQQMPRAMPGTLESFPILDGSYFIELNASRLLLPSGSAASSLDPVGIAVFSASDVPTLVDPSRLGPGVVPTTASFLNATVYSNKGDDVLGKVAGAIDDATLVSRIAAHMKSK